MPDNSDLLKSMMLDERNVEDFYRPGPYWTLYQQRAYKAVLENGISNFRDNFSIGKGYVDVFCTNPFDLDTNLKGRLIKSALQFPLINKITNRYEALVNSYIARQLQLQNIVYSAYFQDLITMVENKYNMPETCCFGTRDVVSMNDKDYSTIYVRFLARKFSFINEGMDFENKKSFIEIGGGFGATTHLLISLFPKLRKVIYIDIPPMIYIATEYLRHFYGDNLVDYEQTRERKSIRFTNNDELEIFCLCPWQLPLIEEDNIDFLWNAGSFSEMTPNIVDNYAHYAMKNLGRQSDILLMLNKPVPHHTHKIALPNEVTSAFESGGYKFNTFSPRWALPSSLIYMFGKNYPRT